MWQNCHFLPHLPLCLSALSVLPAPTLKTKMAARAGLLQRPFWLPQMGAGGLSAAFPGESICCSKSDGSPATEKKKSRNKNHFNHSLTEKPHSRQQDGWIYPLGKLKSYFLYSTFAFKVAIRAEFSGGLYVLSCTVYSLYLLLLLYTAFLQHFWLATQNFGRGTQEQNHEWAEEMVNRGNKMLVLEQEVLIS